MKLTFHHWFKSVFTDFNAFALASVYKRFHKSYLDDSRAIYS